MKYQSRIQFNDQYKIKEKSIKQIKKMINKIEINQNLIDSLYYDSRKTTTKLAQKCEVKLKEKEKLAKKMKRYKVIENEIYNKGYDNIYGFFSTGMYAAAGPITTVVINIGKFFNNDQISYSYNLTENKRKQLFEKLIDNVNYFDIYHVNSQYIDKNGIKDAIKYGYNNLYKKLKESDDSFYIFYRYGLDIENKKIIISTQKKVYILATASIIAKCLREKMMAQLAKQFPGFGFDNNHGYITNKHRKYVKNNGFSSVHRRSFDFEKKLEFEF
ncbi:MAG: hypothetical protein K9K32_06480 [Halanaerobiales bacterium]|nr:hypothetical protein [Halanaerobiales bacterium]